MHGWISSPAPLFITSLQSGSGGGGGGGESSTSSNSVDGDVSRAVSPSPSALFLSLQSVVVSSSFQQLLLERLKAIKDSQV